MPIKKNPIPAGISPGGRKTVASSLGVEAADTTQDLKSTLADALGPLMSEIKSINTKMGNFQQMMLNMQKKTGELEKELGDTTKKVTAIETKTSSINKRQSDLEKQLISVQLENSKTRLRFQDVPEIAGDLKQQMSAWLAPVVGLSKEEFQKNVDDVYRLSTNFTKKNGLPREIHIKLTEKKLRDEILKKANEKQLTFEDKKIRTLKDVPFLVRQKRRRYKKLTGLLIQNKIMYIWCMPEGLKFTYKNEHFKLTTEEKMKDFLRRHGGDLGAQGSCFSDAASEGEEEGTGGEEEKEEEEQTLEAAMAAMAVKPKKKTIQHYLRPREK